MITFTHLELYEVNFGEQVIVYGAFFLRGIFFSLSQGTPGSAVSSLLPALSSGRRSRFRGAYNSVQVAGEETALCE
jgi:hypothetical protein